MKSTKIVAAAITVTLTLGLNVSAFAGVAPSKTTQENRVEKSEKNTVNKAPKNIRPSQDAPSQGNKICPKGWC
ncbi:hypothetical protein [Aphanothece sacrum]|uniref:GTP-binding protein TypA n=1 Tax=Aphanothece sacrum FPU1 TaxID=1920663 RepID=A0A401IKP0_APHSA|nr:hypothetical protein [Aphanothece sacrum]GBF81751.1 GTP-binding protein TypA [Aphanothece sacrum FPU1]GBF85109.1 GTP-binding protein TypA [Aphanothece sacrum FPU3]